MPKQKARPSGQPDDLRVLSFDRTVARLAYIQSHRTRSKESGEPCECRVCGGGLQGIYQTDATSPLVPRDGMDTGSGSDGGGSDSLPSTDGKTKNRDEGLPWWQKG